MFCHWELDIALFCTTSWINVSFKCHSFDWKRQWLVEAKCKQVKIRPVCSQHTCGSPVTSAGLETPPSVAGPQRRTATSNGRSSPAGPQHSTQGPIWTTQVRMRRGVVELMSQRGYRLESWRTSPVTCQYWLLSYRRFLKNTDLCVCDKGSSIIPFELWVF